MARKLTDEARYRANRQGEFDSSVVYRAMAKAESDARLASVYIRLAEVEERHLGFWEDQLEDPKEIIAYLEKLDRPKPRLVPVLDPPDELLKDCVHYVTVRWNRLPTRGRARERFKTDFIGMMLHKFGSIHAEKFSPVSGPEEVTPRKVGRPRKKVA